MAMLEALIYGIFVGAVNLKIILLRGLVTLSFPHIIAIRNSTMKMLPLFATLFFFANVQMCFGDMIFMVTATSRVDTATQVTLTYSVTGAADVGTQDVAAYSVRVSFPNASYPLNSLASTPLAITRAPDNTPFGPSAGGPFTLVSVSPSPNAVRWQANVAVSFPNPINQTIDTAGAPIGSFDLIWNRPTTGQYDAAMLANNMSSGYNVAPFTNFDSLLVGQNRIGVGVSTTISAVPEPSSITLVGLLACLGAGARRYRRRSVDSELAR